MPKKVSHLSQASLICSPNPAVEKRPLIAHREAQRLETTFKVLANSTRLRLLHALIRRPEMCVSELCEAIEMKPQAVSNQLQRLVDRGIVSSRRNGTQIHYRIVDPCVPSLLDQGLCLTEDARKGK